MPRKTLAIDIGGTKFTVGLFEGETLVESLTTPTYRDGGPNWMLDRVGQIAGEWPQARNLDGCGIGFGGPVDFASQRVVCSTHVEGWQDFDLAGEIANKFGVRTVMDRDSMAGALGEGLYGAGIGFRPLFYVTISTGIGGGLLTGDGLYRGADSFAGEIGHHTVVPDGPECLCGSRGCLERLCCGLWLERDFGRPAIELFEDAGFVESYVVPLARGLKNCIMFLNPARIVIGGGIAKAGDRLFVPLRNELDRQLTSWSKARIDVVPAALVDRSVLWGALALARQHLYQAFC